MKRLIDESPSIAVYFCKFFECKLGTFTDICLADSEDCEQCSGVLEELENIDDDCNRHQIKFVKTQDFTIAEQYGITDFPVLVYFEDNVPNVFEGKEKLG